MVAMIFHTRSCSICNGYGDFSSDFINDERLRCGTCVGTGEVRGPVKFRWVFAGMMILLALICWWMDVG